MHSTEHPRAASVAVVTDLPDLRSLLAGAAASRRSPPSVSMFGPGDIGRAWTDCDSVILGPDAVAGARPYLGGVNRPSRVIVAVLHPVPAEHATVLESATPLPGVTSVVLPQARHELTAWLDDIEVPATVGAIAVMGGRGGAGASTAAVALARAAVRARGGSVLVDADPFGGGLDLAVGMEATTGARWPDLIDLRGGIAARWLLASLPTSGGVSLVSHGREAPASPSADAVAAVLDACLAASPAVVVDLPRHDASAVGVALARCSTLVLVVPAEVRACAAAAALLNGVAAGVGDVRLLVRGPSPSGLSAEDVAAAVGVPTFAEVRTEAGLAAALERGEPVAMSGRSPLRRWADALLASWGRASTPWWGGRSGPADGPVADPQQSWGLP